MRHLSLIALAILASGCATSRIVNPATPIRVLAYNIHAGKDARGVDNLDRVAAIIIASGADVVLLQEVDSATRRAGGVDQLAALADRTGMHGAFGSTIEWQGGSFGLAILSRAPIESHSLLPLITLPQQPRVGYSREPRGVLVARIATPDGSLALMNTHLDASRDGAWRRQEVAHLTAIADSLRETGARVLLGGDLNAQPSSQEIQSIALSGFQDSWTACGKGPGPTFPAAAPVRRIDYVFLSAGMSCFNARVLTEAASDHRALLVEMHRH